MAIPDWVTYAGLLAGGGGITGAALSVLKIGPERRKLAGEAQALKESSAITFATNLAERLDKALERIDALEDNEDRQRVMLAKHHDWDMKVVQKLRELEVAIPDPPPLFLVS